MQCNYDKNFMDNLSSDIFKRQAQLFLHGIDERTEETINYIQNEFKNKELLYSCVNFVNFIFLDGFKSYMDVLQRIGFLPSNETQIALQDSISHLLVGSYRSAYDHLKRALEMICVTIYFSDSNIKRSKANAWLSSSLKTPSFMETINRIFKSPVFKHFDTKFSGKEKIITLCHAICDFTHIRGFDKSSSQLELSHANISGVFIPSFSKSTLDEVLATYIEVVQTISTMLALYNPILLVELPVDEKFGYNGPMGGFFQGKQPDRLRELIPIEYQDFFDQLILEDEEILSCISWFNSQPDITEEEIRQQESGFMATFINNHPRYSHNKGLNDDESTIE